MSTFVESQALRLCAEVDRYAQKLGFVAPPDDDCEGESVPCKVRDIHGDRCLVFTVDDRVVTVAITEKNEENLTTNHTILPCGANLMKLVGKTAKIVVHSLFDPKSA